MGDDSIRLLGFQNQSALPALYDLADTLVLPSENEDFGIVVNEAMNARCAVIVTDKVN
jgi:glycosyltransferase involved in cell wall biosynthesis